MEQVIKYSAILENHYYWSNGPAIKYQTRNICSESTAKILEELAKILFPDEEIEIYVIPAKDWCHQDSFLIKVWKVINSPMVVAVSSVLLTAYFAYPLTNSQIQVNQTQIELNKLEIEKLKIELDKTIPKNNITDEQYKKIITNSEIKKNKNRHFEQLRDDYDIKQEKIIAKQNNKVTFEKTIERKDFLQYIEVIPKINIIKTVEKIHHLTVIKPVNDEEYKDLMWIVEDINWKEKFWVHMWDEDFYKLHLENVIWLKTLIARVKYTLSEDQDWIISIKNKEVVLVYQYNWIDRKQISEWEEISPAPLEVWKDMKENFQIIETVNKKEVVKETNQQQLFNI